MKLILILIDIIVLAPAVFFALYLALLTVAATYRRPRYGTASSRSLKKFAILVPAHNEEAVIGNTLDSLNAIDYPVNKYDVIVIADNCSDKTARLSRSKGVVVLERFDESNRGKGQALRWSMDKLKNDGAAYDAFVIIDADTVASANLLTVMNNYLGEGAECIQCSTLVIPEPGAWSPETTRIGFLLHNYVRPLGKKALGLSMGLNGNGMCLSATLLSRLPWSSFSRVEDLEYALQLVLENVKVFFAPEATVKAMMPTDSRLAESQRRRWEIARFSLIRKYAWPLTSAAVRKKSIVIMDMLLELITPAFVNLFLFTTTALAINTTAAVLFAAPAVGWISLAYCSALLLEVFHVLYGLKVAGANSDSYLVLMNTPKYAVWKLRLYLKTLMNGDDKTWLRTERDHKLASRN